MIRRRPFQKKITISKHRVNERIRAPKVRLIDEEGNNLGEIDTKEALDLAKKKELDLIEVAPNLNPPVCKIMNYGKYLYTQEKKARIQKSKSKQTQSEVKGLRISFMASEHDLKIMAQKAKKFLEQGHKVKVEMRLRGREKTHKDIAEKKFHGFVNMVETACEMEGGLKKMGETFFAVLTKKQQ